LKGPIRSIRDRLFREGSTESPSEHTLQPRLDD
jgi:hypothetical protein